MPARLTQFAQSAFSAALLGAYVWLANAPAAAADNQPASPPGEQTAQKMVRQQPVTLNYLLYLPKAYAEKESWPLLVFLHGAGERGDDLELVKKHGPPRLIGEGKEFPFIVVSPQCPSGRWWEPFEVNALVDEIVEKHHVDQARICVTGLSMGGFGTWALAGYRPDRFAAIVPICGGGDPFIARRISKVPTWVFHGGKDPVVPLDRSEKMIEAIRAAGGEPKFTVYAEAGHDSWTEAYNSQELWDWLAEQHRGEGKPE